MTAREIHSSLFCADTPTSNRAIEYECPSKPPHDRQELTPISYIGASVRIHVQSHLLPHIPVIFYLSLLMEMSINSQNNK